MATATYDLIASQTLGSAASSITFSSIAANWTDLRLVVVCQTGTSATAWIRYNGDTGSNYSNTYMEGNGSTATSSKDTNNTFIYVGEYTFVPTSNPGLYTIDIFSYAGSTYKTLLSTASLDANGSGGVERAVGLWRSTSAITSVTFQLGGGATMNSGATASLYGIKAA